MGKASGRVTGERHGKAGETVRRSNIKRITVAAILKLLRQGEKASGRVTGFPQGRGDRFWG